MDELAGRLAKQQAISKDQASAYLSSFSYDLAEEKQESLSEFMRYAFFHGVLPDVPEINFFELDSSSNPLLN